MAQVIPYPEFTFSRQVAETVRVELTRRLLKQAALAAALGISQASMSSKLRGKTPFTLDELKLVADYLRVDVGDLVHPRRDADVWLPRLDSNQQPSDYLADVLDLATARARRRAAA